MAGRAAGALGPCCGRLGVVCTREAKRLAWGVRDGFFDDLVVELHDGFAQNIQHGGAALREVIVPSATLSLSDGGLRT
jgi:hypothetical protein